MLTIERLCARVIRLIHTPVRVYNSEGSQVAVYVDNGEQQDPVACDTGLLGQLLAKRQPDYPVLHLEDDVVYGVFCNEESTYITGPCCLGQDPAEAARKLVRRHGLDRRKPYRIYCTALLDFSEILLTLFECLTGIAMDWSELCLKNFGTQEFEQNLREKIQEVFYVLRENAAVHNPYSQELMEQDSIRNGDLEGLYNSFQIPYVGQFGILSSDRLRHAKNMAIVVITLASRSAIRGGLLPEVAFSMSDAYIQHSEELQVEAEIYALIRQVEVDYCKAVADLSNPGSQSVLLTRCKKMIAQRLHSRVLIKDLARELDITSDYLARLFLREEGIKPTEYILREKINSAKQQLAYSSRSYNEIAQSLAFASQSHFGQAFKKYAGMTPKQYREIYQHVKADSK